MKISKEMIIPALIKVLMTVSGLLTYKLIALTLGSAGILVMGQIKSIVAVIMQIGIVGSNNLIVKLFSRGHNNNSQIYSTIIAIVFLINFLSVILGLIFSDEVSFFIIGNYDKSNSIIYLILSIPAISLLSISTAIANGKSEQINYGFFVMVYPILFLSVLYLFNVTSINSMIVMFSSSLIISSLIIYTYYRASLVPKLRKIKLNTVKKISIYGMTMIIPFTVNLSLLIYMRHRMTVTDMNLAGYWQSVFQVNDNIVSVIYIFIITVLLPKALKYKTSNEAFKYLKSKYIAPLGIYVIGSLIFYFFSSFILTLLYSKSFTAGEEFIVYQLIGDFFKIFNWMFSLIIISFGLLRLSIIIEGINLVYSLCLIEYFLDNYGIIGASYAYVYRYVGYFIITSLFFYIYIKKGKLNG